MYSFQTIRVRSYIEEQQGEFRTNEISEGTGISEIQVRKIMHVFCQMKFIKVSRSEGRRRVYIKINEYHTLGSKENDYNFRYQTLRHVINTIRAGNFKKMGELQKASEMSLRALRRYVVALMSEGIIDYTGGYFTYKGKGNLHNVGKDVDPDILKRERLKYAKVNEAKREDREFLNLKIKDKVI